MTMARGLIGSGPQMWRVVCGAEVMSRVPLGSGLSTGVCEANPRSSRRHSGAKPLLVHLSGGQQRKLINDFEPTWNLEATQSAAHVSL